MTANGILQVVAYFAILTALVKPLGAYMARVYMGEKIPLGMGRVFGPLERATYRVMGVDPTVEQDWKRYTRSVLVFSTVFFAICYAILRLQGHLPGNPTHFGGVPWDVTFNTTASFITNTNWQFYAGETTMSYFSQMGALAVQNFISAAVGMAVLAAVIRGFASRGSKSLGNFWADTVRTTYYILLPLAVVLALLLVSQGVVQTFGGPIGAKTVAGAQQLISVGPAASQVAIKQLGTNGGGFYNVNSAHPLENPTQFSNLLEILAILLIPAALTYTYGRMVGRQREGWAIYVAMLVMAVGGALTVYGFQSQPSHAMKAAHISAKADGSHAVGGNLQDSEQRNGVVESSLWANVTTDASNGSVNSAHESYNGGAAAVILANMMTGEVIFGGVGSGLYGMLMLALLAVFLAGLMVGRTPEYLGKKIQAKEIKLVLIGTLVPMLVVLVVTGLSVATKWGDPSVCSGGPRGFSETLYAYTSQGNNNGSAFACFTGFVQPNAPGNKGSFGITFADVMGGLTMLIVRFVPILAAMGIAGSLATKRVAPAGIGTMRTDNGTFVVLLVGSVLLLALLNFIPALLLGPVAQQLTSHLF